MIEILRGIRVIKIFRAEDTQTRLSVEKGEAFYDNVIEQLKVQKLTGVVNESLSGLLIVAVILVRRQPGDGRSHDVGRRCSRSCSRSGACTVPSTT